MESKGELYLLTHNITILRYTNSDDDYTNSSFTDKIILDVDSKKNTKVEGIYYTDCEIFDTNSLVRNQAVNTPTGMLQDLGKFEIAYKLIITATRRAGDNNSKHASVGKIKQWRDEELQNDNWEEGKFGIILDDFADYNVIPVNTGTDHEGLIFYDLHWKLDNMANPPNAVGTLWFVKSRGDGS